MTLRLGLAPDDAGIRHAAGQRLAEEVGDDFLHLAPLGGVRQVPGLVRTEMNPGGRDRPEQLGALRVGPLELGKELASGGERGVVGGGAEAVDRLRGERARLTFARDFLGGLPHLEGKRRQDGAGRGLPDFRHRASGRRRVAGRART